MSIFSSHKKIFLLGFVLVILLAIPFSVYIAQQRQKTVSKADASTTLSFEPASSTVKVGDDLVLSVMLDPKTETQGLSPNQVSFVKLSVVFDSSKFTAATGCLAENKQPPNTLTFVLEDPVCAAGTASISLSIGADPANVLTAKAKIATLKLIAKDVTIANNPTSITFSTALNNTQVLSVASSDKTSENVLSLLSSANPASVTINPSSSASATPTPTASPGNTPTPTIRPSAGTGGSSDPFQGTGSTGTGTAAGQFVPTIAPIITQAPPIIVLPPTGPGENILGIGIIGAILTFIGGALFILF